MNRNILNTMEKIFDNLKDHVRDDDSNRILDVKRHITPTGDTAPVCEFVKTALEEPIHCASESLCMFDFKDQRYLLLDERFQEGLTEIGFAFEENDAIIQGAGMLSIANRSLLLAQGISSLQVIEQCLGVEPDTGIDITFEFSELKNLFTPYCVVRIDESRFQLIYKEDFNRLICYLLANEKDIFTEASKVRIKSLLLLQSSRSIAGSILNGLQSSLIEYTFLQIYQCIEYLFRLNNCFTVSEMHGINLEKSIDIVLAHEFKTSELENLYQVLKDNASEISIQTFLEILPSIAAQNSDVYRMAANYIYKLRCNIAHLRYKQDDISSVDWVKCITALIEILYSIYQKRDADIVQICTSKNSWCNISIVNCT